MINFFPQGYSGRPPSFSASSSSFFLQLFSPGNLGHIGWNDYEDPLTASKRPGLFDGDLSHVLWGPRRCGQGFQQAWTVSGPRLPRDVVQEAPSGKKEGNIRRGTMLLSVY